MTSQVTMTQHNTITVMTSQVTMTQHNTITVMTSQVTMLNTAQYHHSYDITGNYVKHSTIPSQL